MGGGEEASFTREGQWLRGSSEEHVSPAPPGELWAQEAELQGLGQLSVG